MENIALIERLDAEGQVLQMHRVHHWPQKLGRALDNDLVIDDPHVAAYHAELQVAAPPVGASLTESPALVLQVGETLNGVIVPAEGRGAKARHFARGQTFSLQSGAVFQVGGVPLRLRLPGEVLAPELPMPVVQAHRPWVLLMVALVWLSVLTLDQWTQGTASTPWLEVLTPVLEAMLLLVLWCAGWALLSKLFRGYFAFAVHWRIALPWVAGMSVLVPLLGLGAFAFSWPALERVSGLLEAAAGCTMAWRHMAVVLPRRKWLLGALTACSFVVVSVLMGYGHYKKQKRWFESLYSSTISLPALRLAPALPLDHYLKSVRTLEDQLKDQLGAADDDDDPAALDAEEEGD